MTSNHVWTQLTWLDVTLTITIFKQELVFNKTNIPPNDKDPHYSKVKFKRLRDTDSLSLIGRALKKGFSNIKRYIDKGYYSEVFKRKGTFQN